MLPCRVTAFIRIETHRPSDRHQYPGSDFQPQRPCLSGCRPRAERSSSSANRRLHHQSKSDRVRLPSNATCREQWVGIVAQRYERPDRPFQRNVSVPPGHGGDLSGVEEAPQRSGRAGQDDPRCTLGGSDARLSTHLHSDAGSGFHALSQYSSRGSSEVEIANPFSKAAADAGTRDTAR
jgi:hypothetical protein